jgi:hypothetical protein
MATHVRWPHERSVRAACRIGWPPKARNKEEPTVFIRMIKQRMGRLTTLGMLAVLPYCGEVSPLPPIGESEFPIQPPDNAVCIPENCVCIPEYCYPADPPYN